MGDAIFLAPGTAPRHSVGADTFQLLGGNAETGDGFSMIEYEGQAGVPGPSLHVHHTFDEGWYILEGEVEFQTGVSSVRAGRGAFLVIPRETPHRFEVVGESNARWIGIFSPGRYVEMLVGLGQLMAGDEPADPQRFADFFARYDTENVG